MFPGFSYQFLSASHKILGIFIQIPKGWAVTDRSHLKQEVGPVSLEVLLADTQPNFQE